MTTGSKEHLAELVDGFRDGVWKNPGHSITCPYCGKETTVFTVTFGWFFCTCEGTISDADIEREEPDPFWRLFDGQL